MKLKKKKTKRVSKIRSSGKQGLELIAGNNPVEKHLTKGYHGYELPEG